MHYFTWKLDSLKCFVNSFRFPVKLICCIAFRSASSFLFIYLNLLQLAYNIYWNRDDLVNKQLCNHHLNQWQFSECYHMFLNQCYCSIKETSFNDHNIVIFYFYNWKKILLVTFSDSTRSSNIKTKSLFTSWKLGSIKKSKYLFCACCVTLDWYLFQLINLWRHDSNCFNSFTLSWVDKMTTGT